MLSLTSFIALNKSGRSGICTLLCNLGEMSLVHCHLHCLLLSVRQKASFLIQLRKKKKELLNRYGLLSLTLLLVLSASLQLTIILLSVAYERLHSMMIFRWKSLRHTWERWHSLVMFWPFYILILAIIKMILISKRFIYLYLYVYECFVCMSFAQRA